MLYAFAHNVFGGSLHTVFPPVQYIFVFDHYWQSLRIFISYPAMNAVHCMQSQTKTARRQNVNRSHFIGNRRLTDLWICIHIVVFCASRPNVHGILILIKDNDAMILDVINENENVLLCVCGTTLPLTQAIFTQSNATGKVILYIQP